MTVVREIECDKRMDKFDQSQQAFCSRLQGLNEVVVAGLDENAKECEMLVKEAAVGVETRLKEHVSGVTLSFQREMKGVCEELGRQADFTSKQEAEFRAAKERAAELERIMRKENSKVDEVLLEFHNTLNRMEDTRAESIEALQRSCEERLVAVMDKVDEIGRRLKAHHDSVAGLSDSQREIERRLEKRMTNLHLKHETLAAEVSRQQAANASGVSAVVATLKGLEKELLSRSCENRFLVRRGGGYSYRCLLEASRLPPTKRSEFVPSSSTDRVECPKGASTVSRSTRSTDDMLKRLQKIGRFPTVDDEGRLVMTHADQIVRIEA